MTCIKFKIDGTYETFMKFGWFPHTYSWNSFEKKVKNKKKILVGQVFNIECKHPSNESVSAGYICDHVMRFVKNSRQKQIIKKKKLKNNSQWIISHTDHMSW